MSEKRSLPSRHSKRSSQKRSVSWGEAFAKMRKGYDKLILERMHRRLTTEIFNFLINCFLDRPAENPISGTRHTLARHAGAVLLEIQKT